MPILPSDLQWRYSTLAGSAGDTLVAGGPGTSLGRWVSKTLITGGLEQNVFPNLTGTENEAENSDYQLVFLCNMHATFTAEAAVAWLTSEYAGGADLAFATDNLPASPIGAPVPQASNIPNKNTAPQGAGTWATATSKEDGLVIGNIPPGHVKGIWIRRHANNAPLLTTDGGVLAVDAGTPF